MPEGYQAVPEEDRRKAQVFFDRAKAVADTGNFDYAIEMYLAGLACDPDAIDAHQALREVSLKRKASGGRAKGFVEALQTKRAAKDDKQAMLAAERLLAYDPGNTDHMVLVLQSAYKAGYYDTVMWVGPILLRANADSRSPEFGKFITLKDHYKLLEKWREATGAAQEALKLRPDEMNLATEVKNLGALETMEKGKYVGSSSFRASIKDMDAQKKLIEQDKDVRSTDSLLRAVQEAQAEWQSEPEEIGKLSRYVDALERTEDPEHENRALEVLEEAHRRTGQFRFRQRIGRIKMRQMNRMARSMRDHLGADHADYRQFVREQLEFELAEFKLWSENYPTDMGLRYEVGRRLFALARYEESIPVLQQARQDPKFRFESALLLGRCFMESNFIAEAVDTLGNAISDYQLRGNDLSKELHYWLGRALEIRGDREAAGKQFSTVAQWEWNYRDVQTRLRAMRAGEAAAR